MQGLSVPAVLREAEPEDRPTPSGCAVPSELALLVQLKPTHEIRQPFVFGKAHVAKWEASS